MYCKSYTHIFIIILDIYLVLYIFSILIIFYFKNLFYTYLVFIKPYDKILNSLIRE